MNYSRIEKKDRANWRKTFFLSCLLHIALLAGIYYLNAEMPSSILPDFVLEWFPVEAENNVAATRSSNP